MLVFLLYYMKCHCYCTKRKKYHFNSFKRKSKTLAFYLQRALSGSMLSARALCMISCLPPAILQMFVSLRSKRGFRLCLEIKLNQHSSKVAALLVSAVTIGNVFKGFTYLLLLRQMSRVHNCRPTVVLKSFLSETFPLKLQIYLC